MTLPQAFQLVDVSKRYGRRWALARLSYALPQGSSLLLTGHNGSGKTTLLRLLATMTTPTAGQLQVLGSDARGDRETVRQSVAMLGHDSFLYEDLSATQNLTLLAELLGVESPATKVTQLLDRVGLARRTSSPVRQFSAGMRKRLAIARLLLKAPRLVLLDEPFGELDPAGIAFMEETIRGLQKEGATLVLATHLVDQGLTLCQQRLHLEDGREAAA
jgi:heme exporter protein A